MHNNQINKKDDVLSLIFLHIELSFIVDVFIFNLAQFLIHDSYFVIIDKNNFSFTR